MRRRCNQSLHINYCSTLCRTTRAKPAHCGSYRLWSSEQYLMQTTDLRPPSMKSNGLRTVTGPLWVERYLDWLFFARLRLVTNLSTKRLGLIRTDGCLPNVPSSAFDTNMRTGRRYWNFREPYDLHGRKGHCSGSVSRVRIGSKLAMYNNEEMKINPSKASVSTDKHH